MNNKCVLYTIDRGITSILLFRLLLTFFTGQLSKNCVKLDEKLPIKKNGNWKCGSDTLSII